MDEAKVAPHTPENDEQGGSLVKTVTSATVGVGGAKPAVIAARGSYLAKTASYFDEPDAGQSSAPAGVRPCIDPLRAPSGPIIQILG